MGGPAVRAAFLGAAPLYVATGMNHFMSDDFPVREVGSWDAAEARESIRSDLSAMRERGSLEVR